MKPVHRVLLSSLAVLALAGASACAQGVVPTTTAAGAGCVADGPPQTGLPRDRLTIQTTRGPAAFDVQVAADDPTREKGLMFVRSMPDDQGMLFVFDEVRPLSFWMHNTYIPLDLVFVGDDGRILNVAARAPTCNDNEIRSAGAARAVIELNAGVAERLGIRAGDRVTGQRIFPAR